MSKLSDADKRFFALRKAGYRGPVDQDGYRTTDAKVREKLARERQGLWDALLRKHGVK